MVPIMSGTRHLDPGPAQPELEGAVPEIHWQGQGLEQDDLSSMPTALNDVTAVTLRNVSPQLKCAAPGELGRSPMVGECPGWDCE